MATELQPETEEQPAGVWEDDEYEDEWDDEDIDAKAEEMARRLGEELLANISNGSSAPASAPKKAPTPVTSQRRSVAAAITTIKAILAAIENDLTARSALESTIVPHTPGDNVLDTLKLAVTSGTVSKSTALVLSPILVSLARSDVLFHNLRLSNASSIQLDKRKRKREIVDDGNNTYGIRSPKRAHLVGTDLQTQVNEAVRIVAQALESSPVHPLDPSLVSNIRLQLHQVFLFAVTSSAGGGGHDMHTLQEISGLIQVIGVLSGIQIRQPSDSQTHPQPIDPPGSLHPWQDSEISILTDIGTAVYPCLIGGCRKTFQRLYSLRAHQRLHSVHRPFRCHICPASFARNHDLKRHVKLHDKKAWKCVGCQKMFSRRDAIKRHKTGSKTRGPRSEACITAEVVEVDLDEEEGEDIVREERRAKLWSGIVTSEADAAALQPSPHGHSDPHHVEEGEIHSSTLSAIQTNVLSLHDLLRTRVGTALGSSAGQVIQPSVDPVAGQATLASVIARAQMQTMPVKVVASDSSNTPSQEAASDDALQNAVPSDAAFSRTADSSNDGEMSAKPATLLSMYGLSEEQAKMLEEAIASAASAAQAQAEAEAALEEEDEDDEGEEKVDSDDRSETE